MQEQGLSKMLEVSETGPKPWEGLLAATGRAIWSAGPTGTGPLAQEHLSKAQGNTCDETKV